MSKSLEKLLQLSDYFWHSKGNNREHALKLADALDESGIKQYELMIQHLARLSTTEIMNDVARIEFSKKMESLMTSSAWLMGLAEEAQEEREEQMRYEKRCVNF